MSSKLSIIEILKKLVSIDSQNPFEGYYISDRYFGIGKEQEINLYIEDLLSKSNFEIERQYIQNEEIIEVDGQSISIPARWNILARRGPKGINSPLFFGHTDTVDAKQDWKSDPFILTSRTNEPDWKMYGLGANDMKAGLATILSAAMSEETKHIPCKLAFLADEEYWSIGAHQLCESNFLENTSIAFCPEICDEVPDENGLWLGLGRLGRTEFEFKVKGRSCHGADCFTDKNSINAVHESILLQKELIEFCHSRKRKFSIKNDTHEASNSLDVSNAAYLNYHIGGNPILSIPENASFILDRSFIPDENSINELEALKELIKNCFETGLLNPKTKVLVKERKRPSPPCDPFYYPLDDPQVAILKSIYNQEKIAPLFGIGRSVADENIIAKLGITTLTTSPTGGGSHTSDEWVDIRSVYKLEKIFRRILLMSDSFVE